MSASSTENSSVKSETDFHLLMPLVPNPTLDGEQSFRNSRGILSSGGRTLSGISYENLDDTSSEVQELKDFMRKEGTFKQLMERYPQAVIPYLKRWALETSDTFSHPDIITFAAFDGRLMLTRGFDEIQDANCRENWISIIDCKAKDRFATYPEGWSENVKITAYSVIIKNAGAVLDDGVLKPLLDKEKRGAIEDEVWDIPTVQAIVEFKWNYLYRYLFIEFIVHLIWLLSFLIFLSIYIEMEDQNRSLSKMDHNDYMWSLIAYAGDAGATLCFCYFLWIEISHMIEEKPIYINDFWSILTLISFLLQMIISSGHFTHICFNNRVYNAVLAFHCAILFLKIQYYSRLIGKSQSHVEALTALVVQTRHVLLFIITTMISAAFFFAVLYKEDVEASHSKHTAGSNTEITNEGISQQAFHINKAYDEDHSVEDFGSVARSLGSSFAVLLGGYDTSYVYRTTNRFTKEFCFIFFQLIVSITALNVLIAVMTNTYARIMDKQRRVFYRGRARVILKLESTLAKLRLLDWKPYIHFIVVEKRLKQEYKLLALETKDTDEALSASEFQAEMDELHKENKSLKEEVARLHQKINKIVDCMTRNVAESSK